MSILKTNMAHELLSSFIKGVINQLTKAWTVISQIVLFGHWMYSCKRLILQQLRHPLAYIVLYCSNFYFSAAERSSLFGSEVSPMPTHWFWLVPSVGHLMNLLSLSFSLHIHTHSHKHILTHTHTHTHFLGWYILRSAHTISHSFCPSLSLTHTHTHTRT